MRDQAIVMCAALVLTACAESSQPEVFVLEGPGRPLDMPSGPALETRDQGGDLPEETEVDMDAVTDMGPPAHAGRDWIQTSDFEQFEMTPQLRADWERGDRPCTSDIETAVLDAEFFLPEPSDRRFGPMTAAEFLETLGVGPAFGLGAAVVNASNRPLPLIGDGTPFHAFVQDGEDVVVSFYSGHESRIWDFREEPFYGLMTVMLNYEPVQARYTRWSPDRSEVMEEHTGAGFTYVAEHPLEIVEVRIPASEFSRGTQELGIFSHVAPANTAIVGFYRRFHVHKNAITPMEFPCFEPPLGANPNALERKLFEFRDQVFSSVVLIPEKMLNREALFETHKPIEAAPGERITVFASAPRSGGLPGDTYLGAILFLNDEPQWDKSEFFATSKTGGLTAGLIDWRRTFTVELPEEPGVHTIRIASWTDPFTLGVMLDGSLAEPRQSLSVDINGSNVLTFLVREPDAP